MQVTVPVLECNIENPLVFTRLNCTTQQCWELSRQEGASLRIFSWQTAAIQTAYQIRWSFVTLERTAFQRHVCSKFMQKDRLY